MNLGFEARAWEDLQWWLAEDSRELKRIIRLIEDTLRNPTGGLGKPERFRGFTQEVWSKRITHQHRMVYWINGDTIVMLELRGHYVWPRH